MLTLQKIQDLSADLKAAPKVDNLQRRIGKDEALQKLLPSLKVAHANGHDPDALAAKLEAAGLKVSPRALARLLRPPKPQNRAP